MFWFSKWMNKWWYRYLFAKPYDDGWQGWVRSIRCRLRNHPEGIVYFNSMGLEPDYHCRGCGDELG